MFKFLHIAVQSIEVNICSEQKIELESLSGYEAIERGICKLCR